MNIPAFLVLIAFSALMCIRSEYREQKIFLYIFKPLTTIFIIFLALQTDGFNFFSYKNLILAGLVFSLFGDVFLMLPKDRFVAGLASFLMAHLLYIFAFSSQSGFHFSWWILLPLLIVAVAIFNILRQGLGKLKIPVIMYMMAIIIMAWQALEWWNFSYETRAIFASIGAILFVFSDSVLAIDRFSKPFKSAKALILLTYYSAQVLIVLSTVNFG